MFIKSIMQNTKECYLCRYIYGPLAYIPDRNLEEHHVFNGPNRKLSECYGLKVWLCVDHHRNGINSVHRNIGSKRFIQAAAQKEFEKTHSRQEFMGIFGRNYL